MYVCIYIRKWTFNISSVSKSKSCKFSSAVSGAALALWRMLESIYIYIIYIVYMHIYV